MKIKPQRIQKHIQMKVGIPEELYAKVVFYQKRLAASSPAYIVVEALDGFLKRDKGFQKDWEQHMTEEAGALTVPGTVAPPAARRTNPSTT